MLWYWSMTTDLQPGGAERPDHAAELNAEIDQAIKLASITDPSRARVAEVEAAIRGLIVVLPEEAVFAAAQRTANTMFDISTDPGLDDRTRRVHFAAAQRVFHIFGDYLSPDHHTSAAFGDAGPPSS